MRVFTHIAQDVEPWSYIIDGVNKKHYVSNFIDLQKGVSTHIQFLALKDHNYTSLKVSPLLTRELYSL